MSVDPESKAKEDARRRRIGRLAVIFLGLLVLVYLVPLFLSLIGVKL